MEQVVPGDTDLNADGPILDAIHYKEIGDFNTADRILMNLLREDLRCLDAHAHPANFAFESWPEKALCHYNVGVKIGEVKAKNAYRIRNNRGRVSFWVNSGASICTLKK